jgi:hypothetical protein
MNDGFSPVQILRTGVKCHSVSITQCFLHCLVNTQKTGKTRFSVCPYCQSRPNTGYRNRRWRIVTCPIQQSSPIQCFSIQYFRIPYLGAIYYLKNNPKFKKNGPSMQRVAREWCCFKRNERVNKIFPQICPKLMKRVTLVGKYKNTMFQTLQNSSTRRFNSPFSHEMEGRHTVNLTVQRNTVMIVEDSCQLHLGTRLNID